MDATHRWHKLPESVKSRILDDNRDWNVEHHEWWDSTYEFFIEDMKDIGIEVDRIYFSGFWNQGDGACFKGRVCDWGLFLASVGINDPVLAKHFSTEASFSVKHSGHYYHEYCTSFSMEFNLPDDYTECGFLELYGCGEDVRDSVLVAILSQYNGDALEALFTEAFKDHMRTLYRRLEEEYEYLTSDEVVLESLEANDQLDDLIAEYTEELELQDE